MTKTYNTTEQNIALDLITKVSNFRLLSSERDVTGLMLDIMENGLSDRLHVHLGTDGTIENIRGHRRANALNAWLERDAAAFSRAFADGIPCKVYEGLSRVEIENLKADSGNTVGLSHPFEAQMFLNSMFENGVTMAQAGINAAAILDRVWPLKPAIKAELQGHMDDAIKHRAEGNEQKARESEAAFDKRYKKARHGKMQNSKALYDGPYLLMAAYYNNANGELPTIDSRYYVGDDTPMPKRWTMDRAAKLTKAFEADIASAKVNGTSVTKADAGPEFTMAWNEWVAEAASAPEKAKRSMSHKDINSAALGYLSQVARNVSAFAAGEGVQEQFLENDRRAAVAELVAEHNPKLWTKVENEYKRIRSEQSAAVVEAEPEAVIATDEG